MLQARKLCVPPLTLIHYHIPTAQMAISIHLCEYLIWRDGQNSPVYLQRNCAVTHYYSWWSNKFFIVCVEITDCAQIDYYAIWWRNEHISVSPIESILMVFDCWSLMIILSVCLKWCYMGVQKACEFLFLHRRSPRRCYSADKWMWYSVVTSAGSFAAQGCQMCSRQEVVVNTCLWGKKFQHWWTH